MTEEEKAKLREIRTPPFGDLDAYGPIDAWAAKLLGIKGDPAPPVYEGMPLFPTKEEP